MKFIFLAICLSLITIPLTAQKRTIICGKVKSSEKFIINILEPTNGYYNLYYVDTFKKNNLLVGKDSIYKPVKLDNPAFFCIRFTDENKNFISRFDVLLFPGDSLNLHFDLNISGPDCAKYKGSNASGQALFNAINYQPADKFIPVLNGLNGLPANKNTFVKEINDDVSQIAARFALLKSKGLVSPEFVDLMQLNFRALFYAVVIDKFIGNYKQREVISKSERDSILDELTIQLPGTNGRLKGLYNSPIYIRKYFEYLAYKKYHFNSSSELFVANKEYIANGNTYILDKNLSSLRYIEDKKIIPDLWALEILTVLKFVPNAYPESIIDQYCSIFPNNHWEKFLRAQFKNFSVSSKITYQLQSPILYIDSTKNVNNFVALFKELPKGKPIFIDCWATWCGPCLDAFAFNKQLDSLLLMHNIERLYISFDNPSNQNGWKKAIVNYGLGGYHILANKDLISDIKRVCNIPKESSIQIPRYLLINNNGIVAVNDAISPKNFDLIKEQILKNALSK